MLTAVIICVLVILAWRYLTRRPPGLPPGPTGIPIFGYMPFLDPSSPSTTLTKLSKKYGEVMTVRIGVFDTVVINDFAVLKNVLSKIETAGRPNLMVFRMISFKPDRAQGIILSEGYPWQELRRFALRHMKDLGVKSTSINEKIAIEVEFLLEKIHEKEGVAFDFTHVLEISIFNIIWNILTGTRAGVTDPDFVYLMKNVNKNMESLLKAAFLNFLSNFVFRLIPGFLYDYKRIMKLDKWFKEYIISAFRGVQSTYDESVMRHMLDYFIAETRKQSGGELYTDNEVISMVGDLMIAGAETTTTTVRFAILYLVNYPQIQRRIFKDIETEIGTSRRITLDDRQSLVYLEAFILEVQRVANIFPLGVMHRTTDEITIGKYIIPNDTIIIPNLEAIHSDPKYWADASTFLPERFIDESGSVQPNKDGFAPFSLGKRRCLGENLARAELFLFLGNIIQEFCIEPPLQDIPKIDRIYSFIIHPSPYLVSFRRRIRSNS